MPASQYNPDCQLVELTPPTTEYCRQYEAGPIEDIFTVSGKVCVNGRWWVGVYEWGNSGCWARLLHPVRGVPVEDTFAVSVFFGSLFGSMLVLKLLQ